MDVGDSYRKGLSAKMPGRNSKYMLNTANGSTCALAIADGSESTGGKKKA